MLKLIMLALKQVR